MPVTFGSVGDIISLSLLIKDLVESLDDSCGSSAEYQAVIRQLWSLDRALLEVEALCRSCEQTVQLNALSATVNECAEQCRNCITKFHEQVKKFGRSLQPGGSGSFFRDTALKVRWQVSEKEDLTRFRAEINAYCCSINMLLMTTGVTLAKLNDESLQTSLKQSHLLCTKSSATQTSEMIEIKRRLEENNALAKVAASETRELSSKFDMNYFKKFGAEVLLFMQKIWKLNFLTYKAVISLQSSIPSQLERCWTQEPAILEDALGRVTPIHLEFLDSWEAFDAVLEVRFRQLPGHGKIKKKEYALRANSLKKDIGHSLAFDRCFLPGQRIDMSMVFDRDSVGLGPCSGCNIVTYRMDREPGPEVQCPRCKVWYQRDTEMSKTELNTAIANGRDIELPAPRPRTLQSSDNEELDDDPARFRRVRLRYFDKDFIVRVQQQLDFDRVRPSTNRWGSLDVTSQQLTPIELPQIAASFDRQSF